MQKLTKSEIPARVEKAVGLFKSGYNCCQSVFLAYHDLFGIDRTFAASISAPMGGGMGRLREVCGAVSGMILLTGLRYPAYDVTDKTAKTTIYKAVQEVAEAFRAENGAIVCRELLGLDHLKDNPQPSERTAAYYRKRPCAEYVAQAARIIGEKLADAETD